MVEQEYIELINKEIDGANSPRDTARLKKYLAKNPEAHRLYDQLVIVSNMLAEVKAVEPSANLKTNILGALRSSKPPIAEKRFAIKSLSDLLPARSRRPLFQVSLRYAYVFALGVMAAIVFLAIFRPSRDDSEQLDVSDLYGTMVLPSSSGSMETTDHVGFHLNQADGAVTVKIAENLVLAQMHLQSAQELEMVIEFDESDLSLRAFTTSGGAPGPGLSASRSTLKLAHQGDNTYLVIFANRTQHPTPLRVKIVSSGALLFEKSLATARKSE